MVTAALKQLSAPMDQGEAYKKKERGIEKESRGQREIDTESERQDEGERER